MNDPTHYLLPDTECAVMFSGGRSSGYLLYHVLEAYGGTLPDNVKVLFQNTGKERPETLDFIHECETRWDVDLVWLEYRYDIERGGGHADPKTFAIQVDYESASRNGEPFEELIQRKGGFLPNVSMRFCTEELKIHTSSRYLRLECGWKKWHSVLGLRADEPRRLVQRTSSNELSRIYPIACAGVTHREIIDWWKSQPFDLTISSDQGNCDLCFLKGERKLIQLIREDPSLADWWIRIEEKAYAEQPPRLRDGKLSYFRKRESYRDLLRMAESQTEIDFPDEPSIDCFCTD